MKASRQCIDLCKEFEGYHTKLPNGDCQAYLDRIAIPHVWTIGYGCTEGVYEGLVWTKAQAEANLMKELAKHEAVVDKHVHVEMNQNQYDALVCFSYNYGLSPSRCPSLLKAINANDWSRAAELLPALYGCVKGNPIPGLVRRRKAEAKLMNRPSNKEIVNGSTKLRSLKSIRDGIATALPAGGALDYLGYMEPIKMFFIENPYKIVAVMLLLVWAMSKWLEDKTIQDVKEERYVPSGLVVNMEEDKTVPQPTREEADAEHTIVSV